MRFYNNRLLAINLCRPGLGGQTVKKNCVYLRPNLSLTKVNASRCKSTQVGGQKKANLNASPKLASTCESVWPGLWCLKCRPRFQDSVEMEQLKSHFRELDGTNVRFKKFTCAVISKTVRTTTTTSAKQ